jgi:hypothetical protein
MLFFFIQFSKARIMFLYFFCVSFEFAYLNFSLSFHLQTSMFLDIYAVKLDNGGEKRDECLKLETG